MKERLRCSWPWMSQHRDHLEVQLYRNKTFMNFNELFLMHAYTTSEMEGIAEQVMIYFDDESRSEYGSAFLSCQLPWIYKNVAFIICILIYATGVVLILSLFSVVIILFMQRSN